MQCYLIIMYFIQSKYRYVNCFRYSSLTLSDPLSSSVLMSKMIPLRFSYCIKTYFNAMSEKYILIFKY